eukprot:m.120079 g.120079  ORF g.120079 m.120079 type:complete len:77 (-) comp15605_c0_seq21:24-254(-)
MKLSVLLRLPRELPAGEYDALYTAVESGLTSNNTTTTSTLASSFQQTAITSATTQNFMPRRRRADVEGFWFASIFG